MFASAHPRRGSSFILGFPADTQHPTPPDDNDNRVGDREEKKFKINMKAEAYHLCPARPELFVPEAR